MISHNTGRYAQRVSFTRRPPISFILLLLLPVLTHLPLHADTNSSATELELGQMPYLDAVPDPLEGVNRGFWALNKALFRGVIYPASFVYNIGVPKPVRTSIGKAGHNLT